MKKILYSTAIVAGALLTACAPDKEEKSLTLSVVNQLDMDRVNEVVLVGHNDILKGLGIPNTSASNFVILDVKGEQVPYQISATRTQVLIPATVGANDTTLYTIKAGTPDNYQAVVFGKHYPNRVDDIAWENEFSAYRLYGPALQAAGEKAFGYDVWTKRVSSLVVDQRYEMELGANKLKVDSLKAAGQTKEAEEFYKTISYHVDHGNGLDCYKVGPTLGGGTAALYVNKKIVYPYCYKSYRILENGPIRFTVNLTYGETEINGEKVIENRIISSEMGSRLNRCQVFYTGLSKPTEIVTGLVIHPENKDTLATDMEHKYIAYADLTDNVNNNNGVIYVGAICPTLKEARPEWFKKNEAKKIGASGHLLAISDYKPGSMYTYYFGSSWSKYDMPDMAAWEAYLADYSQKLKKPLKVTLQ